MRTLRNTPGQESRGPEAGKGRPFRAFEGMRERSYRRTVERIASAERRLGEIAEKRRTLAALASSSQASVVNEDESNWDEAMAHLKKYHSSRRALKPEASAAAFCLFSNTMFKVALLGGASLVMLHTVVPDMSLTVDLMLGAVMAAGTLVRTWAAVSTGNEDFLATVSKILDEQNAELSAEKRRLIKKLHGWNRQG